MDARRLAGCLQASRRGAERCTPHQLVRPVGDAICRQSAAPARSLRWLSGLPSTELVFASGRITGSTYPEGAYVPTSCSPGSGWQSSLMAASGTHVRSMVCNRRRIRATGGRSSNGRSSAIDVTRPCCGQPAGRCCVSGSTRLSMRPQHASPAPSGAQAHPCGRCIATAPGITAIKVN